MIELDDALLCSNCGFIGAFNLTTQALCPLCWRDASAIRNELRRGKHPDEIPANNALEDDQLNKILSFLSADRKFIRKLSAQERELKLQVATLESKLSDLRSRKALLEDATNGLLVWAHDCLRYMKSSGEDDGHILNCEQTIKEAESLVAENL